MVSLGVIIKKIERKFQLLKLDKENTLDILQQGRITDLKRQYKVLTNNMFEILDMELQAKELWIEEEKSDEEIKQWSESMQQSVKMYKRSADQLQCELSKQTEKEEKYKCQRNYKEHKRIEEMKMEMKKQLEEPKETKKSTGKDQSKVHLPKLIISKFQGTHWLATFLGSVWGRDR